MTTRYLALISISYIVIVVRPFGTRSHQTFVDMLRYATEIVCVTLGKSYLHSTTYWVIAHSAHSRRIYSNHFHITALGIIG